MQGTIKKLQQEKGFGFITPEGGERDVFFHTSDCPSGDFSSMKEGDSVTFEMGDSPKGPKAVNVTVAA